ncbi:elongation factor P 5-aminopentanone reductase [Tumebacillus permanentifrigoris]|uniref:3-oxoacyl-[acyl-carrier protein] reductase n=1 Tax=Tumebacillus permanentifrigoris TaxID=378543 RepID=A0A316D8T0_9BACL|nr:3-oxoacyl-ACP reductase FabG [Tumebacillus permanentifrigoris]PWK11609.1 3-oxoacyl-[acyl-carrier protein] reductase [Tumebacillus permanentifrigoris]
MTAFQPPLTGRPLTRQHAIVTGASRGIGAAIAVGLARAGANVVINYRQNAEMAESVAAICRKFDVSAITLQADVSRADDVNRLIETATVHFGAPAILVNNAGVAHTGLLLDMTEQEWDMLMSANLKAPFLCTRAILPHMIRQQYGRIINLSSIWGLAGGSCEVAYSASKGGVIAMTKALAKEMGPSGITVNAVAPGAIQTDMLGHLSDEDLQMLAEETPVGRLGTAEDVANAVTFLALPSSSFLTGQILSPNGGYVT